MVCFVVGLLLLVVFLLIVVHGLCIAKYSSYWFFDCCWVFLCLVVLDFLNKLFVASARVLLFAGLLSLRQYFCGIFAPVFLDAGSGAPFLQLSSLTSSLFILLRIFRPFFPGWRPVYRYPLL